jgi:glycosyltransferase involved in cell wall biosynthesis
MKIAILLNLSDETSGGSYQFNKSIYESLITKRQVFRHELFFVFQKRNQVGSMPDLALPTIIQHRFYFLKQFVKEIFNSILSRNKISIENCRSSWLNRNFLANDIKAVWSVNPLSTPLDLPYLTTSWDISHKITPYFKEISGSGIILDKRDQVCKSVFRKAFRIIVGTEHGKNEIFNSYGINPERIVVEPLPVPHNSSENKLVRNQYQFIYPANFWPHKNHFIIVKALSELIAVNNLPIKFIFTGSDMGNLEYIKRLVTTYDLDHLVEFKGFISRLDLNELYETSNACVFPSLIGPDNLPPLEALTYGCKALVADIPGARDQFSKFAVYFDPYNSQNLAMLIHKAIIEFKNYDKIDEDLSLFLKSRTPEIYIHSIMTELDKLEVVVGLTE